MLAEGIALGWVLIVLGAVLLLVEVYQPGFFIAVPATVLIILGILLLGVDILSSPTGLIVGVLAAIVAASVTVWLYGRLTPGRGPPTTLSRDSLIGLEGTVITPVDPETLAGKVRLGSMEWSARSASGEIPAGRRVIVVRSEGVHVIVKEVV
ncbi:NfeD family protein [Methanoculleus oceani]|uniref:Clp protease ClpP n=1 Tax=Methanoculleus oceani TaxID=2184756 RepID=A0ABD4TEP6_9EURY|nr:NfeD family protein [Methanoculleus sp. CWC-02]MCM2465494.1 Clp protease ClpP [Methanoculleus sp. CWC-02]